MMHFAHSPALIAERGRHSDGRCANPPVGTLRNGTPMAAMLMQNGSICHAEIGMEIRPER